MFDPNLYNDYYSRATQAYQGGMDSFYGRNFYTPMQLRAAGVADRGSYYSNAQQAPLLASVAAMFTGGTAMPVSNQSFLRTMDTMQHQRSFASGRGEFLSQQMMGQLTPLLTAINRQRGVVSDRENLASVRRLLTGPVGRVGLPLAYSVAPDMFEGLFGRGGSGLGLYDAAYNTATYRKRSDGTRWDNEQHQTYAQRVAQHYYGTPEAREQRQINSRIGGQLYSYLDREGMFGPKNEYGARRFSPRTSFEGLTDKEMRHATAEYFKTNDISSDSPPEVKRVYQQVRTIEQINKLRSDIKESQAMLIRGGTDDKTVQQNMIQHQRMVDELKTIESKAGLSTKNTQAPALQTTKLTALAGVFEKLASLRDQYGGDDDAVARYGGNDLIEEAQQLFKDQGIRAEAGEEINLAKMGGKQLREFRNVFKDAANRVKTAEDASAELSILPLGDRDRVGEVAWNPEQGMKNWEELTRAKTGTELAKARTDVLAYAKDYVNDTSTERERQIITQLTGELGGMKQSGADVTSPEAYRAKQEELNKAKEDMQQRFIGLQGRINSRLSAADPNVSLDSSVTLDLLSTMIESAQTGVDAGTIKSLKGDPKRGGAGIAALYEQNEAAGKQDNLRATSSVALADATEKLGSVGLTAMADLDLSELPIDDALDFVTSLAAFQSNPALAEFMRVSAMIKQSDNVYSKMEDAIAALQSSVSTANQSLDASLSTLHSFADGNLFNANLDTLGTTVRQSFLAAKELGLSDAEVTERMSRSGQMTQAAGLSSRLNPQLGYSDLRMEAAVGETMTMRGTRDAVDKSKIVQNLETGKRGYMSNQAGNFLGALLRLREQAPDKEAFDDSDAGRYLSALRSGQSNVTLKNGQQIDYAISQGMMKSLIQPHVGNDGSRASDFLMNKSANQGAFENNQSIIDTAYLTQTRSDISSQFMANMMRPGQKIATQIAAQKGGTAKEQVAEQEAVSSLFNSLMHQSSGGMFSSTTVAEVNPENAQLEPDEILMRLFERELDTRISQATDADEQRRLMGIRESIMGDKRQLMKDQLGARFSSAVGSRTGLSATEGMQTFNVDTAVASHLAEVSQRNTSERETVVKHLMGGSMFERVRNTIIRNGAGFDEMVTEERKRLQEANPAMQEADVQAMAEKNVMQRAGEGIKADDVLKAVFNIMPDYGAGDKQMLRVNKEYNALKRADDDIMQLEKQRLEIERATDIDPAQKADLLGQNATDLTSARQRYTEQVNVFKASVSKPMEGLRTAFDNKDTEALTRSLGQNQQLLQGVYMERRTAEGGRSYHLVEPGKLRLEKSNGQATGAVQYLDDRTQKYSYIGGTEDFKKSSQATFATIQEELTDAQKADPNYVQPESKIYKLRQQGDKLGYDRVGPDGQSTFTAYTPGQSKGMNAVGVSLYETDERGNALAMESRGFALAGDYFLQGKRDDKGALTGEWEAAKDRQGQVITRDSRVGKMMLAAVKNNQFNRRMFDDILKLDAGEDISKLGPNVYGLLASINAPSNEDGRKEADVYANRNRKAGEITAQTSQVAFKNKLGKTELIDVVRDGIRPDAAARSRAQQSVGSFLSTDISDNKKFMEFLKTAPEFGNNESLKALHGRFSTGAKQLERVRTELARGGNNIPKERRDALKAEEAELTNELWNVKAEAENQVAINYSAVDDYEKQKTVAEGTVMEYLTASPVEAVRMLNQQKVPKGQQTSWNDARARYQLLRNTKQAIEGDRRRVQDSWLTGSGPGKIYRKTDKNQYQFKTSTAEGAVWEDVVTSGMSDADKITETKKAAEWYDAQQSALGEFNASDQNLTDVTTVLNSIKTPLVAQLAQNQVLDKQSAVFRETAKATMPISITPDADTGLNTIKRDEDIQLNKALFEANKQREGKAGYNASMKFDAQTGALSGVTRQDLAAQKASLNKEYQAVAKELTNPNLTPEKQAELSSKQALIKRQVEKLAVIDKGAVETDKQVRSLIEARQGTDTLGYVSGRRSMALPGADGTINKGHVVEDLTVPVAVPGTLGVGQQDVHITEARVGGDDAGVFVLRKDELSNADAALGKLGWTRGGLGETQDESLQRTAVTNSILQMIQEDPEYDKVKNDPVALRGLVMRKLTPRDQAGQQGFNLPRTTKMMLPDQSTPGATVGVSWGDAFGVLGENEVSAKGAEKLADRFIRTLTVGNEAGAGPNTIIQTGTSTAPESRVNTSSVIPSASGERETSYPDAAAMPTIDLDPDVDKAIEQQALRQIAATNAEQLDWSRQAGVDGKYSLTWVPGGVQGGTQLGDMEGTSIKLSDDLSSVSAESTRRDRETAAFRSLMPNKNWIGRSAPDLFLGEKDAKTGKRNIAYQDKVLAAQGVQIERGDSGRPVIKTVDTKAYNKAFDAFKAKKGYTATDPGPGGDAKAYAQWAAQNKQWEAEFKQQIYSTSYTEKVRAGMEEGLKHRDSVVQRTDLLEQEAAKFNYAINQGGRSKKSVENMLTGGDLNRMDTNGKSVNYYLQRAVALRNAGDAKGVSAEQRELYYQKAAQEIGAAQDILKTYGREDVLGLPNEVSGKDIALRSQDTVSSDILAIDNQSVQTDMGDTARSSERRAALRDASPDVQEEIIAQEKERFKAGYQGTLKLKDKSPAAIHNLLSKYYAEVEDARTLKAGTTKGTQAWKDANAKEQYASSMATDLYRTLSPQQRHVSIVSRDADGKAKKRADGTPEISSEAQKLTELFTSSDLSKADLGLLDPRNVKSGFKDKEAMPVFTKDGTVQMDPAYRFSLDLHQDSFKHWREYASKDATTNRWDKERHDRITAAEKEIFGENMAPGGHLQGFTFRKSEGERAANQFKKIVEQYNKEGISVEERNLYRNYMAKTYNAMTADQRKKAIIDGESPEAIVKEAIQVKSGATPADKRKVAKPSVSPERAIMAQGKTGAAPTVKKSLISPTADPGTPTAAPTATRPQYEFVVSPENLPASIREQFLKTQEIDRILDANKPGAVPSFTGVPSVPDAAATSTGTPTVPLKPVLEPPPATTTQRVTVTAPLETRPLVPPGTPVPSEAPVSLDVETQGVPTASLAPLSGVDKRHAGQFLTPYTGTGDALDAISSLIMPQTVPGEHPLTINDLVAASKAEAGESEAIARSAFNAKYMDTQKGGLGMSDMGKMSLLDMAGTFDKSGRIDPVKLALTAAQTAKTDALSGTSGALPAALSTAMAKPGALATGAEQGKSIEMANANINARESQVTLKIDNLSLSSADIQLTAKNLGSGGEGQSSYVTTMPS
jgi:hypothetical protein